MPNEEKKKLQSSLAQCLKFQASNENTSIHAIKCRVIENSSVGV